MHFEVTISKMNEAKAHISEAKNNVEKSHRILNEAGNSSVLQNGSLKGVGDSVKQLSYNVSTEKNECDALEQSLGAIKLEYSNVDKKIIGDSGELHKKNSGSRDAAVTRGGVRPRGGNGAGGGGGVNNRVNPYEIVNKMFGLNKGETTSLNFETDLMVVDSMDYLPISDFKYAQVYTGYTDEEGVWHAPLNSLHDSATPPNGIIDWEAVVWQGITGIAGEIASSFDLLAGDMMHHYYCGNGKDYYYDAAPLLQNPTVNLYFQDNVNDVAMACTGNIADGETVIIANSGSHALPGCHSFIETDIPIPPFAYAVMNANTFGSINAADAGIVCEITRDGDQYYMRYDYYIIDYYDYDPGLLEPMYNVNTYGTATSYMSYGKISGTATWNAESNHVLNVPAVSVDIVREPGDMYDFTPLETPLMFR